MNTFPLPAETHVSRVHLRTPNLERALSFYRHVIGLRVIEQNDSEASLSATGRAPAALLFTEDRNAFPRPEGATGLYHFAILFPTRRDLANALRRLLAAKYSINGMSDHVVGESIHLNDPDGNGLELYIDNPRSEWPMRDGRLQPITRPLNVAGLLATAGESSIPACAPAHTSIGHLNLHVANLAEAEKFYHDFLGLEVMTRIEDSATFLAAGDYHHHIAVNTWGGKALPQENAIGLISYRLTVPNFETIAILEERAQLFGYTGRLKGDALQIPDPNGNWLELGLDPIGQVISDVDSAIPSVE